MEMQCNMICEFVRFDSQVNWKICVEYSLWVCVCRFYQCIHSSCVEDQKEPMRLFCGSFANKSEILCSHVDRA